MRCSVRAARGQGGSRSGRLAVRAARGQGGSRSRAAWEGHLHVDDEVAGFIWRKHQLHEGVAFCDAAVVVEKEGGALVDLVHRADDAEELCKRVPGAVPEEVALAQGLGACVGGLRLPEPERDIWARASAAVGTQRGACMSALRVYAASPGVTTALPSFCLCMAKRGTGARRAFFRCMLCRRENSAVRGVTRTKKNTNIAGGEWGERATRKRRYAHAEGTCFRDDEFVEEIEAHWKRARQGCEDDGLPQPNVHNLVGTARLNSSTLPLHLEEVARLVPNLCYDQQKFAAITLRLAAPQCTVLLFTSGKMVLTGCKSYIECVCAACEVLGILRVGLMGMRLWVSDVKVQNVVGNADVGLAPGQCLDLERMLAEHPVHCTYIKNMFPGLIFRPKDSPVVLLLFHSGKVVITGGKSMTDVRSGWRMLWPTVREYIRE